MQPIDFESARRKMVDQQIRPWEVADERLLDAIRRTPREDFVAPEYRNLAYVDMNLPLGDGHIMMAPRLEARLLQALNVGARDKVLEIGTGSGYVTALLAALAAQVYAVEINTGRAERTKQLLSARGIRNVSVEIGDAARGWPAHAPYDAILATGSMPLLPNELREQLAPGGRLVAIVGAAPAMEAIRIERLSQQSWDRTSILETVVPPLLNSPAPLGFTF
ncbi:MAG TPA: protein-L-isoaspartate O-methyltransferase [Burkholderiales bacterium]|jgi:protein-L-isoaspartate(D-aspartate) O-methyltransferase